MVNVELARAVFRPQRLRWSHVLGHALRLVVIACLAIATIAFWAGTCDADWSSVPSSAKVTAKILLWGLLALLTNVIHECLRDGFELPSSQRRTSLPHVLVRLALGTFGLAIIGRCENAIVCGIFGVFWASVLFGWHLPKARIERRELSLLRRTLPDVLEPCSPAALPHELGRRVVTGHLSDDGSTLEGDGGRLPIDAAMLVPLEIVGREHVVVVNARSDGIGYRAAGPRVVGGDPIWVVGREHATERLARFRSRLRLAYTLDDLTIKAAVISALVVIVI